MLVSALLLFFGDHDIRMVIPRGTGLETRQGGGRLPERLTGDGHGVGRRERVSPSRR